MFKRLIRLLRGEGSPMSHGRFSEKERNLASAVLANDVTIVSTLISERANVNIQAEYSGIDNQPRYAESLLHQAITFRYTDIVRILLEAGADPEWKNSFGETPLIAVLGRPGDAKADIVRYLLARKVRLETRRTATQKCNTALLEAVAFLRRGRSTEAMELLLEAGADANTTNENGMTPLMYVSNFGVVDAVSMLLNHKADPSIKDETGRTAHSLALEQGHHHVVELLRKAETGEANKAGQLLEQILEAAYHGKHAEARELIVRSIEEDIDINIRANSIGKTLLMVACWQEKNLDVVRQLLDKGASINATDDEGTSVLHDASRKSDSQTVKLLLERGAHIESKGYKGRTPLFEAAEMGKGDVAAMLREYGVDVEARDDDGSTPLFFAQSRNVAEVLLKGGAAVNSFNKEAMTPLHEASMLGRFEVAKVLVENGANVDRMNNRNATPLMCAINGGADGRTHFSQEHIKIFRMLLDNGADVNIELNTGATALYYAAKEGYADMVEQLLDKGANPHAKAEDVTPLYIASVEGHVDTVKALLKRGADPHAVSYKGYTALEAASREGHSDIVQLFEDC